MKTLHNIFKTEKIEKKKELKLPIIEVDYREQNSLVPTYLKTIGFQLEIKELKVADYIVKGIAIERKTVEDFLGSMLNGRLVKQLEELQQYEQKLLFIEGIKEQELYTEDSKGINPNAIRGFLLSIVIKYNVPIIFTKHPRDTAKFIETLAKKKQREAPLNVRKKAFNQKEQLQYIVESFPGIGPKTAKKILTEFKTLRNFINSDKKQIEKVLGKKGLAIHNLFEANY